jgi:hercynylcysteine S-oxide lyase
MTSSTVVANQQEKAGVKFGKELRKEFLFDSKYLNLNHGKNLPVFA